MKLFVFVAIFLLMFCASAVQPQQKVIVLKQQFNLKIGERAVAPREGLKIEFDSVAEDSRCPKDVTCVWAGNAKVLLKVHKDAARPENVELNTNLNPKTFRYLEYELRLEELKPYPQSKTTTKSSDYEVTLTVCKLGN